LRDFAQFLLQIQRDLNNLDVDWCLIGGLAVAARGEPRFTKDIDLAVATPDDRASEGLIFALQGTGYRILAILEQQVSGRLATVRLSPPGSPEPMIIDLLFASSGIESSIVQRAELMEVFPKVRVQVASLGDLIAMKILARDDETRPQDRLDLKSLLGRSSPSDRLSARQALEQIMSLQCHRGRELAHELQKAEAEFLGS
jgi:hypothetical protein